MKKNPDDFKKLSAAEKRVAIAKDVLKQLKAKKYTSTNGTYFDVQVPEQVLKEDELFHNYLKQSKSCEVCALGAMFCSLVNKNNKIKIYDMDVYTDSGVSTLHISVIAGIHEMLKCLSGLFSKKQLVLIETAYEDDCFYDKDYGIRSIVRYSPTDKEFNKAVLYHYKYPNSHDRLVGIMKNIIKNEGMFVP